MSGDTCQDGPVGASGPRSKMLPTAPKMGKRTRRRAVSSAVASALVAAGVGLNHLPAASASFAATTNYPDTAVARQQDLCAAVDQNAHYDIWADHGWPEILGALPPVSTGLRYSDFQIRLSRPSPDGATFDASVVLTPDSSDPGNDPRVYFYQIVGGQVVRSGRARYEADSPGWMRRAGAMASLIGWVSQSTQGSLMGRECVSIRNPYGVSLASLKLRKAIIRHMHWSDWNGTSNAHFYRFYVSRTRPRYASGWYTQTNGGELFAKRSRGGRWALVGSGLCTASDMRKAGFPSDVRRDFLDSPSCVTGPP